jgi:hypothetical protein
VTASASRDELQAAIDALARSAHALALLLVPLPPGSCKCAECAAGFKTPERLAEHAHNVHGGPVPEHWRDS